MNADEIKALVERLREDYINPDAIKAADALETLTLENERIRLEFRADCERQAQEIFAVGKRLVLATQELKNIANADTIAWDDPTEYEAWAKNRARWALGKVSQIDKTKP